MRKFLIEALLITTSVVGTGYVLFMSSPPSDLAVKINSIERKLDIINLGNSHGFDIDYQFCNCNGLNLNKEGNTLYYDLQNFFFLDRKGYLSDSAIVLIPVSYFALGLGENREDRLPDDSFVNDFYFYLPRKQIYNYSYEKRKTLIIHTIQKNFKLLFDLEKTNAVKVDLTSKQLEEHALKRSAQHKKLAQFRAPDININYIRVIITQAKSKGYKPILVCTPYYYWYNHFMGEAWLSANYFNIMDSLSKEYNIPFLDYSHDKRFLHDPTLFGNSDHLNEKGKSAFSKIIFGYTSNY